MAWDLFGFKLQRKDEDKIQDRKSFVPATNLDGAVTIDNSGMGMFGDFRYGTGYDSAQALTSEFELITKYREMSLHPLVSNAIEEYCNEAIVVEDNKKTISVILDDVDFAGLQNPETIKKSIEDEFNTIYRLLNFRLQGYDLFKQFYIDGKLYHHIIIDEDNKKEGIQELRFIDPRQISLIRKINRRSGENNAMELVADTEEFFVFSPNGIYNSIAAAGAVDSLAISGLKIEKDCISYIHSGVLDKNNRIVLSHLEKASKYLNQLTLLEDSTIIYRLSRAPERRIFYVDVGNMPRTKAMQYLRQLSEKYKNKVIYDPENGEISNKKNQLSMMEDYWLPRREGNKGTEISTLPGGVATDQVPELEYFKNELAKSLGIPISRLDSSTGFNIGKTSEISRDELKFNKFIRRLQNRFAEMFIGLLRIQLSAKEIMSADEFDKIKQDIQVKFESDSYFTEFKQAEILRERFETISNLDNINQGRYFSKAWIRREVLKMTEDEIKQMQAEIKQEEAVEPTPVDDAGKEIEYTPGEIDPSQEDLEDTIKTTVDDIESNQDDSQDSEDEIDSILNDPESEDDSENINN